MGLVIVPPTFATSHPHIMIDGAAKERSMITLSHWPASPTPPRLRRDLSYEIVMAYLDNVFRKNPFLREKFIYRKTKYVTLDHLDEDGILSAFAILNPNKAFRHRKLFADASRLGDFNIFPSEDAAVLTFGLRYLLDPQRSYLFGTDDVDNFLHQSVAHVFDLIENYPKNQSVFADLADEEMASFAQSRSHFLSGRARIKELPKLSLAVVEVDLPASRTGTTIKPTIDLGVHPAAVHSLTDMMRIVICWPDRLLYYDRYETWVRFVSRRLAKRPNLELLATELNLSEDNHVWHGDPSNEPLACLCRGEKEISTLSNSKALDIICKGLEAFS